MKKHLLLILSYLVLNNTFSQIISENFNNGIPNTWTVNAGGNNTTLDNRWHGTTNGFNPFGAFGNKFITGNSEFAIVDSEGAGFNNDDQLETPSFNGTSYSSILLSFNQVYEPVGAASTERGYVQVWNGSTWNTVLTLSTDTYGTFLTPGAPTIDSQTNIDITAYKNANMKVRFSYFNNGNNGYWWAIDDVIITGTAGVNPPLAQFSASNTSTCEGSSLLFNDLSTNAPSSWTWTVTPIAGVTFAGGTNQNSQNPQINFANSGSYSVKLKVLNNNGSDSLTKNNYISVAAGPTVSAGSNQTFCENNVTNVSISGTIGGSATGSVWSSSGSNNTINNTSALSTVYSPTQSDINSGSVTLSLSTLGGGCSSISDDIIITFTDAPSVDAGIDQNICANNSSVSLNGVVTLANGQDWTTTGAGTFNNISAAASNYIFDSTDFQEDSLIFTLTTTGNGNCLAESDEVVIYIEQEPIVNAGSNQTVCKDSLVSLLGLSENVSSTNWSTNGSGIFGNAISDLNNNYTPGSSELGSIEIYLTGIGIGSCSNIIDTLNIVVENCNDTTPNKIINKIENINYTVFPNPNSGDKLYVFAEKNSEIEIFSMVGEKLFELDIEKGENEINIHEFQKGVYLLMIKDVEIGVISTQKIMIK